MILKNVRIAYPHLFEPYAYQDGPNPKYEATFMIPKDDEDQLASLRQAVKAAAARKWEGKKPSELHNPIKDGDELSTEAFNGHWIVVARSKPRDGGGGRPGVVLPNLQPANPEDIQSGDFVNADVNAYAYDTSGNKGVSFGLNNVQLCMKGDRIGAGKSRPENVFDALQTAGSPEQSGEGGDDENWF